VEETG